MKIHSSLGGLIIMNPGDLVVKNGKVWEIKGVYYGGISQESVVGLKSVTQQKPSAHGEDIEEMFVPIELIKDYVFTHTKTE